MNIYWVLSDTMSRSGIQRKRSDYSLPLGACSLLWLITYMIILAGPFFGQFECWIKIFQSFTLVLTGFPSGGYWRFQEMEHRCNIIDRNLVWPLIFTVHTLVPSRIHFYFPLPGSLKFLSKYPWGSGEVPGEAWTIMHTMYSLTPVAFSLQPHAKALCPKQKISELSLGCWSWWR